MNTLDIVYAILELLAGIGVFLFGMKLMGDNLEYAAGNKIKDIFSKISDKRLVGVGIGVAATAIVQSSAAITVMAIGFVNSGIMSLTQATAIVFGANIGTTITAQIVALGYGGLASLKLMVIFASFAGVGAFMNLFAKKDIVKKIGTIFVGLGMIFVGLTVMENSMNVFKESEALVSLIATLQNPMLLLLFGIVFTALIQSSSAVSGIVITMSAVGILDFSQAMYIIVGSNIGTCVTSLIASIGTATNAKRVSIVHLLFNVIGVTVFMLSSLFVPYAKLFSYFGGIQTQIAMLHTFFNVVTVLLLLPFMTPLVKLTKKIVPDKPSKKEEMSLKYLAESQLRTPPLALVQLKHEIQSMAELAKNNFDLGINAAATCTLDDKENMQKCEVYVNFLNREITGFLVALSKLELGERDRLFVASCFHTVSDIERIGDYAENMLEYAEELVTKKLSFSPDAVAEITRLKATIDELYALVMSMYDSENLERYTMAEAIEESVDNMKDEMKIRHIERLTEGTCLPEIGAVYLSLASDAERIADHIINISHSLKNYCK